MPDDQLTEADYPPGIGAYVGHPEHHGVAFRIVAIETENVEHSEIEVNDDGEEIEVGGIDEVDTGWVYAVMVGDDHKWKLHEDDLFRLSEEDFCHGCGQTGCTWDVREE